MNTQATIQLPEAQKKNLADLIARAKENFPAEYREGAISQWYLDNRDIMGEQLARLNAQVDEQGEQSLSPEDMAFWLGCMEDDLPEGFTEDAGGMFECFGAYEN
jgi:hypothetical protein